jgi:hypothetical protein
MPRALRLPLAALALALVAAPAGARVPRTLKVRFPPVVVPAGGNVELCTFIRVPADEAFDMANAVITHRGIGRGLSVIHFLVYAYRGEQLGAFAAEAGRVVPSRACLDLGPADRDDRLLIASGTGRRNRPAFPESLVLPLVPAPAVPGGAPDGIGILLDANLENSASRPRRFSTRVVLKRPKPKAAVRRLAPIFERTAEQGLVARPFAVDSTETMTAALNAARPGEPPLEDAWGPGLTTRGEPAPAGDACVLIVSSQMHKRTRFFGVDLVGADGIVKPPSRPFANPVEPGRAHLWGSPDYTDPGTLSQFPAIPLRVGERLRYACWIDNGVANPVRLGCEESAGEAPGVAAGLPGGGPAKPCRAAAASSLECPATDTAYPGRTFTGACVPANAVAGSTPDDETCVLTGFYYDAGPGGTCDLAPLP